MGTVPSPARPLAGVALAQASTDTWWSALNFLLQPPSCRVALTTAVAGWAVATAPIVWNSETWDIVQSGDTEMHSMSTDPERITIRTAGRYRVHGMVALFSSSVIGLQIQVFKNTTAAGPNAWEGIVTTATAYTATFTDEIVCAVGDYLTVQVTPTATGLTVSGPIDVHMVATWVSN
jgi:hypothetical protein